MDKEAARILDELEQDGLTDDTIVIFYGDHGAGMPRCKRWLYDSSTRVPFLVSTPEKFKHLAPGEPGTATDRLISFVDLAPTVLSLAGVPIPDHMQGVAFLGKQAGEPREYVYGFRDRMDERYDLIRMARDNRYTYIRNFHPERPWFHDQYISYLYEMPTMQVWQRLADEGKLTDGPATFMALTKPTEELYDNQNDPDEIHNLAGSPEHQAILKRLRDKCRGWQREILDLGFLPEHDLRTRFGDRPPYDAVRENPESYPFDRIAATADLANARDPKNVDKLIELLDDKDDAIRYWAAIGLGSLGDQAGSQATAALGPLLKDDSPIVRVAAADALCRLGMPEQTVAPLAAILQEQRRDEWARLAAINILDRIDEVAAPAVEALERAREDPNAYVVRVANHALEPFTDRERKAGASSSGSE